MEWESIKRLMRCFPNSFINQQGEFIAHRAANEYFNLEGCADEFEIKCKVLEWFSRGAYKTMPFCSRTRNADFHAFMLRGINDYLGTKFDADDMELIYTYLGNSVNRARTIKFIESGFDLRALEEG